MPTSMVLRFRDLVAETIRRHQECIDRNDYVWWGWWNKPTEKIPRTTFSQFSEIIGHDGDLPIYLVDSGSVQLYKASLTGIESSATEGGIECPEPSKTPLYYQGQEYKVWFRLRAIEEVSIVEIRNWSYDEIDECFEDPHGSKFQDKRVYNLEEMLNRRNNTIYFIKPYEENHKDLQVELQTLIELKNLINVTILRN